MATILVSNIPAAPVPIFPIRSVGAIIPVAIIIIEPLRIPVISTENTLNPRIPPIRTSIYGMICIKSYFSSMKPPL